MDSQAAIKKLLPPMAAAVAMVLAVMTVLASEPGPADPANGGGQAAVAGQNDPMTNTPSTPDEPAIPPKELVPVRSTSEPELPALGEGVALRQLVIGTNEDDPVLPAWKSVLDEIGTPYDVLLASDEDLGMDDLMDEDGIGRYQAIFLTNNALLEEGDDGTYESALSSYEWETLWEYERIYDVRQVSLTTAPGEYPEDYCLRPGTEGEVDDESVTIGLAPAGQQIFDYLSPDAQLPILNSYAYRSVLAEDCAATPVLTDGSHVLGVLSPAEDGRERLVLGLSLGPGELSTALLGYGLVRWATEGVFIGEQRHWLNVDIDDWFGATQRLHADGSEGMFRLTGPEAAAIKDQQDKLREDHPLAGEFVLNLPYNGGRFETTAPAECKEYDSVDSLSSYTRCLADEFRWINHTRDHPEMNTTSYAQSYSEIEENLEIAAVGGLEVPLSVLKTPEYSGLGVYNPDPESTKPPKDHGLEGSNAQMLRAASDLGIKYLHGNMSFESHRPSCFNCGTYHPLQPDLLVVPDWPTNIAFEATTPAEQTRLYNLLYGENGTEEFGLGRDGDYGEVVDAEASLALRHLASGSAYAHTLHQGNLHVYEPRKSLTFDWLNTLLAKYESYYAVPLKTPNWLGLASYVEARNSHFSELDSESDAVWNKTTNEIIYTANSSASMFFTGLQTRPATKDDQAGTDEAENYGSDSISRVGVDADETVALTARPRP